MAAGRGRVPTQAPLEDAAPAAGISVSVWRSRSTKIIEFIYLLGAGAAGGQHLADAEAGDAVLVGK